MRQQREWQQIILKFSEPNNRGLLMSASAINLESFREKVSKLPKEKQIELINELFDTIYSGLDQNVFRVMATAIKYAKAGNVEGHENFQVQEKDLEKLTHIQDKNRLIQQNRK